MAAAAVPLLRAWQAAAAAAAGGGGGETCRLLLLAADVATAQAAAHLGIQQLELQPVAASRSTESASRSDASFNSESEPTFSSTGAEKNVLTFGHYIQPAQGDRFRLRALLTRSEHFLVQWHTLQPPANFTVEAAEDGAWLQVDLDVALDGKRRLVELSGAAGGIRKTQGYERQGAGCRLKVSAGALAAGQQGTVLRYCTLRTDAAHLHLFKLASLQCLFDDGSTDEAVAPADVQAVLQALQGQGHAAPQQAAQPLQGLPPMQPPPPPPPPPPQQQQQQQQQPGPGAAAAGVPALPLGVPPHAGVWPFAVQQGGGFGGGAADLEQMQQLAAQQAFYQMHAQAAAQAAAAAAAFAAPAAAPAAAAPVQPAAPAAAPAAAASDEIAELQQAQDAIEDAVGCVSITVEEHDSRIGHLASRVDSISVTLQGMMRGQEEEEVSSGKRPRRQAGAGAGTPAPPTAATTSAAGPSAAAAQPPPSQRQQQQQAAAPPPGSTVLPPREAFKACVLGALQGSAQGLDSLALCRLAQVQLPVAISSISQLTKTVNSVLYELQREGAARQEGVKRGSSKPLWHAAR